MSTIQQETLSDLIGYQNAWATNGQSRISFFFFFLVLNFISLTTVVKRTTVMVLVIMTALPGS